jgi:hypothetical protein
LTHFILELAGRAIFALIAVLILAEGATYTINFASTILELPFAAC